MVEPVGQQRAEVRVVHGRGLDVEAARRTRLRVDDGLLTLSRPDRPDEVVASVADVRRVVWLDGPTTAKIFSGPASRFLARRNRPLRQLGPDGVAPGLASGACVVVTDRGPVAAWLVDETAPWAGDASTKRRQSGSVALARALGTTLETAGDDHGLDLAAVRSVAIRWTTTSGRVDLLVAAAVLGSLVLAAVSWGGFDGDTVWPYALLSLLLALPVALASVGARRRALACLTRPPVPEGRHVVRAAGLEDADPTQLQLGRDDVVVVRGDGSESWLAGPAVAGGVATVQVVEDQMLLVDARRDVVHMVPTGRLVPDEATVDALQEAASSAGIEVEVVALPAGAAAPSAFVGGGPDRANGDLSVMQPWLMWAVAGMLAVAGFAAAQEAPLLGYLVVAGAGVVLACRVWCWWTWRSWETALRRRGVA